MTEATENSTARKPKVLFFGFFFSALGLPGCAGVLLLCVGFL